MNARHGDRSRCARCGGAVEYIEWSQATGTGTYEVLDAWWAHLQHPVDGHEAVAGVADDAFRLALDVLAAEPPRRRRWWRR